MFVFGLSVDRDKFWHDAFKENAKTEARPTAHHTVLALGSLVERQELQCYRV